MMKTRFLTGAAVFAFAASAFAQAPEKKAAPPAKPGEAAKPAPPKEEAPPKMETPAMTPAKETADAGKAMAGTWKCKGSSSNPDGSKATWSATAKFKLDLDKWWIVGEYSAPKSKTNPMAYKGVSYRGFDGTKWHEVSIDNMGGFGHATTTGPAADGKTTWEGEGGMLGMAGMTAKSRTYEQWVTPNKEIHVWGEMSMDNGKSWMPIFDMTCKK